ncbi:MAG: hybrid sensor histidine kinase/response regulator [Rickettsiales bacterium]
MDELVADFISETTESLLNLDNELVELEANPDNVDLLSKIFRVMHTIKGTCGFIGLSKLASVAHAAENILDKLRSKKITVTSEKISILLEAIDNIKSIVEHIQGTGEEPQTDYSELIARINATISTEEISVINSPTASVSISETDKKPSVELSLAELDKLFEHKDQLPAEAPVVENKIEPTKEQTPSAPEPIQTIETKKISTPSKATSEEHGDDGSNQAIRVKVEVLDSLMQAVSELVLNRNQLLQLDRVIHDDRLTSSLQSLNSLTSSIQEIVMSTRMQPISNAWLKVPRIIRDISKELNKKINLIMIGKETELDKQLIESIKDPLVHMIRNSADHGLEKEEVRLAAGKPAEGTITLQAYHSSGHIIIEVSDDGAGINLDRVKSKILENGLSTEAEINQLSEQQIIQYIFKAGFSTATKVTALSGRGVGMDVVKNNIESIHGSVEIKSVTGKGSTFILKIPLTLAIMPILIVDVKNQKFGIPQNSILEMLRVGPDSSYDIEEMNEHFILRLRDSLIPLVKLSDVLELTEDQIKKNNSLEKDYYIVICEVRGKSFGLIVDNIYDTEEIVLKPLPKLLNYLNVFSGNTLLGSGEVVIILAPAGIAQKTCLLDKESSSIIKPKIQETNITSSFLVVKYEGVQKAIPLELVSRLEEIDISKIENIGNKKVIQYMNSIMYLETLNPNYIIPEKGKLPVVVFVNNEHILGLIVEKIIDIVNQNIEENLSFDQSNLTALVIDNKTMDIVNVGDFFQKISVVHFENIEKSPNFKYKILLAEDNPYFRKFIAHSLKAEGFDVSTAKNSIEVLNLIENKKDNFHLLITDIDLKETNGLELAKLCKQHPKSSNLIIIGLTSNNENSKLEFTKDDNKFFSDIVSKVNSNELIELIHSVLNS